MSLADRFRTRLRHPEVPDLSRPDQVLHRTCNILHWHLRIDAVLIKQVDDVGAQTLERVIADLADARGTAVEAFGRHRIREAELGGDHDLIAYRLESFANNFLVGERTVGFGRVKEGDAALNGGADQLDGFLPVGCGTRTMIQTHAAEA